MGRFSKGEELVSSLLQPGESILTSIAATQCDPPTSKSGTVSGCLAFTDQRVIFAGKAVMKSITRTIPLSEVSSMGLNKGAMASHVRITLAGSFENFLVKYKDAERFMEIAQADLQRARSSQTSSSAASAGSVSDELRNLAGLHRDGVLTDEEFAAAKSRLLDT